MDDHEAILGGILLLALAVVLLLLFLFAQPIGGPDRRDSKPSAETDEPMRSAEADERPTRSTDTDRPAPSPETDEKEEKEKPPPEPPPRPPPPQTTACPTGSRAVTRPVDQLFEAWRLRDIDLYRRQWAPNAVQYLRRGRSRGKAQIVNARRTQFRKLDFVRIDHYTSQVHRLRGGRASIHTRFAMTKYGFDGSVDRDPDRRGVISERYVVVCDERNRVWLILKNCVDGSDLTQCTVR